MLQVILNGQAKEFPQLAEKSRLSEVVAALELKGDRIAVEHNGEIAPRDSWPDVVVRNADRLEIVHFVGGGKEG